MWGRASSFLCGVRGVWRATAACKPREDDETRWTLELGMEAAGGACVCVCASCVGEKEPSTTAGVAGVCCERRGLTRRRGLGTVGEDCVHVSLCASCAR